MRKAWLVLASLTLTACSHDIDTAAPSLAGIQPNLACNQQITKAITITGMNLTPLPTKSLGAEVLNLPTVTLTPTVDLQGNPSSGAAVTVPGSGDDPAGVHVRWENEGQMGFDVFPDLNLGAALYDVGVANPDGKTASLPQALAVVPPPMVGMVVPPAVCDAQSDQMIVVHGTNFLGVDSATPTVAILDMNGNVVFSTGKTTLSMCTPIGMRTPMLQECTTLAFTIPKGAIPPGMYVLRVTNPADAECSSTESIPFRVDPPPHIDNVLPSHVCAGGGKIAANGTGFQMGATLTLSGASGSVNGSPVTVNMSGTTATGSFGAVPGNPGDKLDVTLQNPDGCKDTLPKAVTIDPGPIIFYVDPPFVYGSITTPVTIYTTGIMSPLPSTGAVVFTPHGSSTPTIDLTSKSSIDPNHPKHIIVDVPPGVAAGAYDLTVTDATGCPAFYANAITVVTQTVTLKDIVPPFGFDAQNTAVRIDATGALFTGGVRAYLALHGSATAPAVALSGVVFQSATQIVGVVPASLTAKLTDGVYDVVTVNPDGTIGLLTNGFTVVNTLPPVITGNSPGSLPTNCGGSCNLTLTGQNFVSGATATATCTPPGGTAAAATVTTGTVTPTSVAVSFPTIPSGGGTVCTFRVTQGSVYADGGVLVVTNPAAKLGATTGGTNLNTARRAPGLTFNGPTSAVRNLYAIGGDDAAATPVPKDTVEFAPADGIYGSMGAWTTVPVAGVTAATQGKLPTALTYAGAASVGRFIYNVGGADAAGKSVATVTRAQVLDPADSPKVNDADLTPDLSVGLAPGLYYYRVAAVLGATDANNPSGETLASDEFAIKVPTFLNDKFQVTIAWTGATTTTPVKWRIYRTTQPNAAPASEDSIFETADASSSKFIDTNTGFMTAKPLPSGALGNWKAVATLNTPRAGAGVTVAPDPSASGVFFLYAGYGYNSLGSTAATQFPTSYEVLPVTVSGNTLTESTWNQQTIAVSLGGRWQGGAFAATADVDPIVATSLIYFGVGSNSPIAAAGSFTANTEFGTITTGTGILAAMVTQTDNSNKQFGFGAVTAVNTIFQMGGQVSGQFTNKMNGATITTGAGTLSTFGPQGGGQIGFTPMGGVFTPVAPYLPGATTGQAYFWLVGGATGSLGAQTVSNLTFFVLY